ncbi:MAG: MBL fold metallo-hydrolase [Mangrovicoccus sp.]
MQSYDPPVGVATDLGQGLRRILAPNAGPMTFRGTNTYLLGEQGICVIDPGPEDESHLRAIFAALEPGQWISHILVTHAHRDHSALAGRLALESGAKVYAYGNATAGRSPRMQDLAQSDQAGGGEGVDLEFQPDFCLADLALITGTDWQLEALWTPGHMANHLCFSDGQRLFSGDLVMGWASSLVSPPDGDLSDFFRSCQRLSLRGETVYYPGHGDLVTAPQSRIAWLLAHRREREMQILHALECGPAFLESLTQRVYADLSPQLLQAASRNVLAHLIALIDRGDVVALPEFSLSAEFRLSMPQAYEADL